MKKSTELLIWAFNFWIICYYIIWLLLSLELKELIPMGALIAIALFLIGVAFYCRGLLHDARFTTNPPKTFRFLYNYFFGLAISFISAAIISYIENKSTSIWITIGLLGLIFLLIGNHYSAKYENFKESIK